MRLSDAFSCVGRAVSYHPKLAKPLGGANAVLFFEQIFFWMDKTDNPLGVFKTAAELETETGLSVQEQRTARAKLRERGILIETEKRIEHSRTRVATFPKCKINIRECCQQQPY